MITYSLIFVFLFILLLFLIVANGICIIIRKSLFLLMAFIQDIRVDEFFNKATVLGEIQSHEKDITPERRIDLAYEKSMSIVSDVLLQNGYNPREYNLKGLTMLTRIKLGLAPFYIQPKDVPISKN